MALSGLIFHDNHAIIHGKRFFPFHGDVHAIFGLGHAPGFWVHISDDDIWKTARYPKPGTPVVREGRIPKLLRKYPNLYCDISAGSGNLALSRDPEYAVEFLTEFQDRICYARDYFDNVHQTFLNSLNLPQEILQKIYAGNAEKLVH